jgi:hypothetical protein
MHASHWLPIQVSGQLQSSACRIEEGDEHGHGEDKDLPLLIEPNPYEYSTAAVAQDV